MGATKYEIYTKELIKMADLLKAIAHPARLKTLLIIANATDSNVTVKDILKEIELSQSTISGHLKQIKDVGLVKTRLFVESGKSYLLHGINKPALMHIRKLLNYLYRKADLKPDHRFESPQNFYSKLNVITNWDRCFET